MRRSFFSHLFCFSSPCHCQYAKYLLYSERHSAHNHQSLINRSTEQTRNMVQCAYQKIYCKLQGIREHRWIYKLLLIRGIFDVVVFSAVYLYYKQNNVSCAKGGACFNQNMFGTLCSTMDDEDKLMFCASFYNLGLLVRLVTAVCLVIGGYFVSNENMLFEARKIK